MKKTSSEAGFLGYLSSKETLREKWQKVRNDYNNNPKKCLQCDKAIDYKKRWNIFCNRSCKTIYTNKIRIKKPLKVCLNCGKPVGRTRKYCSQSCQMSFQWKKRKKNIESTKSFGRNDEIARKTCKRYLIERMGNKCQICGLVEWLGKPILLLSDHIDGNHTNNSINNMRIICSNCDSTLDTYKNRNKNKGRKIKKRIRI